MQYIIQEKFHIAKVSNVNFFDFPVLLFEQENSLAGIYVKHFAQKNFVCHTCNSLNTLFNAVKVVMPKVLVLGFPENINFSEIVSQIANLKNSFKLLPIICYSYSLPAELVKELMALGVFSHIDRKFSRPRDLVNLVECLVH